MAGFLYFASGITSPVNDELIDRLELRYAFERSPAHGPLNGRTPSGVDGTIFADEARLKPQELAYRPDDQAWRKRPGDDCVWVGYWKDAPPTPGDLERAKQLSGESVEFADGNAWRIPRLVWHAGDDGFQLALPTYYDLDDKGEWVCGAVDEEYAHLTELADRLHAGVYQSEGEGGKRLTTEEMLVATPTLLAVNYVVSPLECVMRRLFKKGGGLRRAAEVAVDFDNAMDWLEKKSAELSPSAAAG